jgi:hypothetical protein
MGMRMLRGGRSLTLGRLVAETLQTWRNISVSEVDSKEVIPMRNDSTQNRRTTRHKQ